MTVRRLTLVRRHPSFTWEQFAAHWLDVHADIASELPGLRGYRVNIAVERDPGAAWDGFAELWFDSIEAAEQALSDNPVAKRLRRDTQALFAEWESFFVEEHVIVPLRDNRAQPHSGNVAD